MSELSVFLVAWLLPMLVWGGLLLAIWAARLRLAADDVYIGQFQGFCFVGLPFALGSMPITAFTYWAAEAWA
jgi:hypothetical protein